MPENLLKWAPQLTREDLTWVAFGLKWHRGATLNNPYYAKWVNQMPSTISTIEILLSDRWHVLRAISGSTSHKPDMTKLKEILQNPPTYEMRATPQRKAPVTRSTTKRRAKAR